MVIKSKKKIVLFALINEVMLNHKAGWSILNNKKKKKMKRKIL